MSNKFLNSLDDLDSLNLSDFIKISQRGIEKENLRSNNSSISLRAHPKAYGSSLTNSRITTDFSEALIELVTGQRRGGLSPDQCRFYATQASLST